MKSRLRLRVGSCVSGLTSSKRGTRRDEPDIYTNNDEDDCGEEADSINPGEPDMEANVCECISDQLPYS